MKEEGIIHFANQKKNNHQDKENRLNSGKKVPKKDNEFKPPLFVERKVQEMYDDYAEWSNGTASTPQGLGPIQSPHFAKDSILSGMFNSTEPIKTKDYLKPTTSSAKKAHSREENSKPKNQPFNTQPVFRNSHSKGNFEKNQRDSTFGRSSFTKKASTGNSKTREFKHVESKIKDKINYDKELSKQYRKMKESMGKIEPSSETMIDESPVMNPKENIGGRNYHNAEEKKSLSQNPFEESSRNRFSPEHRSLFTESTNSILKNSLTAPNQPNKYRERTHQYDIPSENELARKGENTWRGERYETQTEENRGGMLDIANNFLSSPLMRHLSKIDVRNLDTTMKDSIFQTNNKPSESLFNSASEYQGPSEFRKSLYSPYDAEDGLGNRLQQSQNSLQQSHNSQWRNGGFTKDRSANQNSLLKDSTNKRFKENMIKETIGKTTNQLY